MSGLLTTDRDPHNELIEDQAGVQRRLIIFVVYYVILMATLTLMRYFIFETKINGKDGVIGSLELAFYIAEIFKLVTDSVMLVLFVMEFKILKKLMTSFVKE